MNTTELEEQVRVTAFIGGAAAYTSYPSSLVLSELNDKLRTLFEAHVVRARAGYWLHQYVFAATAGRGRYRIPARAVMGGLEKVEIATREDGPWSKLDEVPPAQAQQYQGQGSAYPYTYVFTVIGDSVELLPAPTTTIYVRFSYYIRPSALKTAQTNGRITVVDPDTRQVTVNALPTDYSLSSPATITSGLQTIDIVHPNGWHELAMVDKTQTISGLVITLGGTDSMVDVEVGDYVRVADQTDWPCLPTDFHRPLADASAIKICVEMHLDDKAATLAQSVAGDVERFVSLLQPRVRAEPKQIPIVPRSRGASPFPRWRS